MGVKRQSVTFRSGRAALVAAAALLGSFAVSTLDPPAAHALGTVTLSVSSSDCSGASGTYTCSSPTVTLSGTAADPGASVAVAAAGGYWLAETKSDSTGAWSVPVTLLANASAYSLDAFEVDTTSNTQGPASAAVSVTVTGNQVITNGSFEQPSLGGASWLTYQSIPGWTQTNPTNQCGIELQSQGTVGVKPYDGAQYDELESNCVSGVTQTVPTVPGTQYTLSFAYQARPNTSAAENTMSVQWGAQTVAPGLVGGSSWTSATYTVTATSSSTALTFQDTDPNTKDSTGGFLDAVSVVPTASLAPSNTSWSNAAPVAGSTASQAITFSGEGLWYKFPVQPGQQVSVQLSNLAANYHILLFSDIAQAQAALTNGGSPNLPVIQAESSGNNASAAQFSPFYGAPFYGAPFYGAPFYGAPFYGAPFYGAPFYGASTGYSPFYGAPFYGAPFYGASDDQAAEADSILAESTQPGTSTQSVQADTWNDTGNFYVEVFSSDGSFSANPYTLTVSVSGGPCQGVTLQDFSGDLLTGNLPATTNSSGNPYNTVIVDNSSAMPQVSQSYTGSDGIYASSLSPLATATNGVVLDASSSTGVQELIAQAKSNPGCPYAANLEAQGIQTLINHYRVANASNLKYVVIIGDDGVVPFFRYADAEVIGPESTYQVPLSSTSSPEAALQNNLYLTDDQYGAASELQINGTLLPIQSASVGRLVETPSDISGAISNYLSQPTITPTSTLTTGYSFMAAPAQKVGTLFASEVGGGSTANQQLIDYPDGTGTVWTATDLLKSLTSTPHQLAFLGAHYSASDALAADGTTVLSTQQFASSIGSKLQNSLVLGAGCHAGYTVDPADATPVTNPLSWPQAMTEAGATLIAGTGYQFGDSNYVADSDQVYVDVAQQLDLSGAKTVGSALLGAKAQYLAGLDQLNGLEEKSLLEITLYGLPMLGVQEPNVSTAIPTPIPATMTSMQPAQGTPGGVLGTQVFDDSVTVQTPSPVTPFGANGSYDQIGTGGVVADPGGPVVPVVTQDVNDPNYTLTGTGFWGGTYTDSSGAPPLTGDPVTDTSQPAAPFSSPVLYPQRLTNPNYFGALETGSDTQLGITPEQYVSDPSTPGNAIKRVFSNLDLHLFYSNNTSSYGGNVPALAAPPDISAVSATETSGVVNVTATVTGDPSAGIQEVWVTYTDPPSGGGTGTWQSVDLTQSSTDPTQWTGSFTDPNPGQAVFMLQGANGIGDVSLDNNQGYFFTPAAVSSAGSLLAPPAATTLTLGGDTSDAYGSSASVTATLAAGGTPLGNRLVTFTIGSASGIAGTVTQTGTATASIPLAGLPPGNYTLTASFAGDSTDAPTSATTPFTITPAPTSLTLTLPASGQIITGAPSGITATLTSGGSAVAQKTVYFEVSENGTVVGGSVGQTGPSGVAQAGVITLPSDDAGTGATVTAYFGSATTPVPGGTSTYDASDPDYAGATTTGLAGRVVDATTTVLSAPMGSAFGSTVTLTAQVTPAGGGSAMPTGTVTFYDGSTSLGTATLAVNGQGADAASITVKSFPAGSQYLSAVYGGSPSFLSSTSGTVVDNVDFTATYSGTYGSPLTITSGQSVLITGTVNASVTVQPGGALEVEGGTVTGPVTASGAYGFILCGATIGASVTVTGSPGYVFVGGGPGCAPTSVVGPLKLSGNTGGVQVFESSVSGPMSVTANSSGSGSTLTIGGNTVGGPLSCSKNNPAPTDGGQLNTAPIENGQCSAPNGF